MKQTLCNVCGKRKGQTGTKGSETSPHGDMCNYCWEEGGYENQHSDSNHAGIAAEVEDKDGFTTDLSPVDKAEWEDFMPTCWICHPELNLAQTEKATAKGSTAPKAQGTRRAQLNHKGHSHPATSAARRACKELFWAQTAVEAAKWNTMLDANGKQMASPEDVKAGTWTVVPSGPKGGVINQLKKGNPEKELAKKAGVLAQELAQKMGSPAKGKFLSKAEGKKLYGK